jgi:hypothetical protein
MKKSGSGRFILKNNTGILVNMAIVDLGIPPGFDVDTIAFHIDIGSIGGKLGA